jgi:hypothetical protein
MYAHPGQFLINLVILQYINDTFSGIDLFQKHQGSFHT